MQQNLLLANDRYESGRFWALMLLAVVSSALLFVAVV